MLVQKLRLQRGWSQQQLAEFAALSPRTIQRLENGQAASLETLKSLAAVFEVDLALLRADSAAPAAAESGSGPVPGAPQALPAPPESPAMTPSAHATEPFTALPADASAAPPRTLRDQQEREALRHVRALRGLYGHAARFAVVIAILAIINALQGPHAPWWVLWVVLGWGLGLGFHALRVLGRDHFLGPQWEKRQVERRLGRPLDDVGDHAPR